MSQTFFLVYDFFSLWLCIYFLFHAKSTCKRAFLKERAHNPATISLPIDVPFSGSGLNGVFLCFALYLFIYLFMQSSEIFPLSNRLSNEISLSCYLSLCITFLMISLFFPPINKFFISQSNTPSEQKEIWTRTPDFFLWRLSQEQAYSLTFYKDLHFFIRLSKSCKSQVSLSVPTMLMVEPFQDLPLCRESC